LTNSKQQIVLKREKTKLLPKIINTGEFFISFLLNLVENIFFIRIVKSNKRKYYKQNRLELTDEIFLPVYFSHPFVINNKRILAENQERRNDL
jgi:hypothetical protein